MNDYTEMFLKAVPTLELPKGTAIIPIATFDDTAFYPRLYLIPLPAPYLDKVDGVEQTAWFGSEVCSDGGITQLGAVDPVRTLLALAEPRPEVFVRALVYRGRRPEQVYIFAVKTSFLKLPR